MNRTKGIIFALISSTAFGTIPFFSVPILAKGMNPPLILFYRNIFCVLILFVVGLFLRKKLKVSLPLLGRLVILSALYISSSIPLVYAYNYIPSGLVTTIHFMYPIGVTLLMAFFFKEKKSLRLFLIALISLFGVAILCWQGNSMLNMKGIFLALLTALASAVYTVLLGQTAKKYTIDSFAYVFWVMLSNAVLLLIVCFLFTGLSPVTQAIGPSSIPIHSGYYNLFGLAIVCTILPNLCFITAVKHVGPTVSSIVGSMEPLTATVLGILFFNELFLWNTIAGLLIIIGSVVYVLARSHKKDELEAAKK